MKCRAAMLAHLLDLDSEFAESKDLGMFQQHPNEAMHRQEDGEVKKVTR